MNVGFSIEKKAIRQSRRITATSSGFARSTKKLKAKYRRCLAIK